jgi:hypothetical protein
MQFFRPRIFWYGLSKKTFENLKIRDYEFEKVKQMKVPFRRNKTPFRKC